MVISSYISLFSLVLLLACNQVLAQPQDLVLTLDVALKRTLKHNPQLHQYTFRKQALAGQRNGVALKPALNMSVMAENFGGSGAFRGGNVSEVTVALSSVLELGEKRKVRTSVVDAQLDILKYQLEAKTLDLLGLVSTQFIHVLTTQESIVLAHEALTLLQETLSLVRSRAKQGAASETEVKRATAALIQSEIHLDALQHQFNRQKMNLAYFWGEQNPKFTSLKGSLFQFNAFESFPALYLRVQASPAMTVFASEERLARAKVQLARTQSKADIRWQVGVKRFEDTGDAAIVAGLEIPLFSGRQNKGHIQSTMVLKGEVLGRKKQMLLKLHERLYNASSYREQHINTLNKIQVTIIPALEDVLQLTLNAYENGRSSYQDWVSAQRELLTAKQRLIDSASLVLENQTIIEQLIAEPF